MTCWTGADLHTWKGMTLFLFRIYDRRQPVWSILDCTLQIQKGSDKELFRLPQEMLLDQKALDTIAEKAPHICGVDGFQIQRGWRLDEMWVHGKSIFPLIKFTLDSYVFSNMSVPLRPVVCSCDSQLWIEFQESVRRFGYFLNKEGKFSSKQKHSFRCFYVCGSCMYWNSPKIFLTSNFN